LKNLAFLKFELNQLKEALHYINDALEIAETIKEPTWNFIISKQKFTKKWITN